MEQPSTECKGHREPWNKGKLVGQKAPLRLKEIWAIRIRLQLEKRTRELALFNLAVDSKLRSCDLLKLRVRDVTNGEHIAARAIVMQQKTQRPVQFEVTEQIRESLAAWIRSSGRRPEDHLSGIFESVDHRGYIQLRLDDGRLKAVSTGDVFFREVC